MKVRRPPEVPTFVWDRAGAGLRLALASRYAKTPERREHLRRAALAASTRELERAVQRMEQATGRGDSDEE